MPESSTSPRTSPDTQSLMPLHPLELRILLVLTEGESHGYSIVKKIEARERHLPQIYPANLYRRIRDLLRKKLIEEAEPPEPSGTDSRRRYFRLTEAGRMLVRAEVSRMESLLKEARSIAGSSST